MAKLYKGDIGVIIAVDTGMDLYGIPHLEIHVLKPSGVQVSWVGVMNPSNTAHIIYSTTTANDLDVVGIYQLQAHIIGDGINMLGDTATITVYDKFA